MSVSEHFSDLFLGGLPSILLVKMEHFSQDQENSKLEHFSEDQENKMNVRQLKELTDLNHNLTRLHQGGKMGTSTS